MKNFKSHTVLSGGKPLSGHGRYDDLAQNPAYKAETH